MSTIHFLNVLEGDCNIIQHDSGRVSVIDISNAYNDEDTPDEKAVKASEQREEMRNRTQVPSNKVDYRQKLSPDNPIKYLQENLNLNRDGIFRFIVTHPDMDHIDGIKDLYTEFDIPFSWDTDNNKAIDPNGNFAGYNRDDWKFYTNLRDRKYLNTKRLTNYAGSQEQYWQNDNIHILCPTPELVRQANQTAKDFHDLSYVLVHTPPKKGGGTWKIVFAGDSHDASWDYILKNHRSLVENVDVLLAPHHGRDSDRSYEFLKVLNPKITLFGNASHQHLAYGCYKPIRITNNQAGYVIMDVSENAIAFYVKHYDFARDFKAKRSWSSPALNNKFKAYDLCVLNA
jgi:competence protein ComEC